ncbi:MAG: hypothetical protein ACHQ4J_05350 [Candidatus Binatia bacterium]
MWRTVRASRVFWKRGGRTTHWSPNLAEELLIGEPMDLTITTLYRRGLSSPTEKKNHGFNQALIEPQDFSRFLRRAHQIFRNAPEQELLRQAVQRLVLDETVPAFTLA